LLLHGGTHGSDVPGFFQSIYVSIARLELSSDASSLMPLIQTVYAYPTANEVPWEQVIRLEGYRSSFQIIRRKNRQKTSPSVISSRLEDYACSRESTLYACTAGATKSLFHSLIIDTQDKCHVALQWCLTGTCCFPLTMTSASIGSVT
jgi:hypothetical protein